MVLLEVVATAPPTTKSRASETATKRAQCDSLNALQASRYLHPTFRQPQTFRLLFAYLLAVVRLPKLCISSRLDREQNCVRDPSYLFRFLVLSRAMQGCPLYVGGCWPGTQVLNDLSWHFPANQCYSPVMKVSANVHRKSLVGKLGADFVNVLKKNKRPAKYEQCHTMSSEAVISLPQCTMDSK